jgi:hypothetical protein
MTVQTTVQTLTPPAPTTAPATGTDQAAAPPADKPDFAATLREALAATGTDAVGLLLAWPPDLSPAADDPLTPLVAELAGQLAGRLGPVRVANDTLLALAVAGELVRWRGEFREWRNLAVERGDIDRASVLEAQYRAMGVPLLDLSFAHTVHRVAEEVRRLRPDAAPQPAAA